MAEGLGLGEATLIGPIGRGEGFEPMGSLCRRRDLVGRLGRADSSGGTGSPQESDRCGGDHCGSPGSGSRWSQGAGWVVSDLLVALQLAHLRQQLELLRGAECGEAGLQLGVGEMILGLVPACD